MSAAFIGALVPIRSVAFRPPDSGVVMQSSAQGPAVHLRLGAILSLLMLLCAPVPAARAGCSAHYVSSWMQATVESFALDPLILSGSVLPPRDETPPSRPTPCSGALYSGNPAVPLSTVPPVMTEGDGDWAISLRRPVLAEPGSIALPAGDAPLSPSSILPRSSIHPATPALGPRPDRVIGRLGLATHSALVGRAPSAAQARQLPPALRDASRDGTGSLPAAASPRQTR